MYHIYSSITCNILYQKHQQKALCALYTSVHYTQINTAYLFEYNAQHFIPKMPTKNSVPLYISVHCTRINMVIKAKLE